VNIATIIEVARKSSFMAHCTGIRFDMSDGKRWAATLGDHRPHNHPPRPRPDDRTDPQGGRREVMNYGCPASSQKGYQVFRPWWWWINPWLYVLRRDRAYEDAIDCLKDAYTVLRKADK